MKKSNILGKVGAVLAVAGSALLPVLAFAQANQPVTNISGLLNRLTNIINLIIPFLVGLAVLFIIYGIVNFISSAGDEEARANAKQFIIWGIIGVFLMLSIWGLVNILVNSIPVDNAKLQNDLSNPNNRGIPVTPVQPNF